MPFTIGKPSFNVNDRTHTIAIQDAPPLELTTEDPTTIVFTADTEKAALDVFVKDFIALASPYFSKPLDSTIFYTRLAHTFDTGDFDLSDTRVSYIVSWIPVSVVFAPSVYTIHWRLISMESSGLPVATVAPVHAKNIRLKIRRARLRCALARLRVEKLAQRYYAKYGNFDGLSESELSSDSDSDSESTDSSEKI